MAKLVVTTSDGKTSEVPLDKERITIGRHPDNQIHLNDSAVSGKHALVITVAAASFIEDLNSTNGTFVNGNRVKKHPLSSGETITIGHAKLVFEAEDQGQEEFERTMVISPGQMAALKVPPAKEAEQPMAVAPAPGDLTGVLQVLEGPFKGRELKLTRALNNLGRPPELAAISRRQDGYYIVHIGDVGPAVRRVQVNGKPVSPQPQKLNAGDTVELLGTKMRFQMMKA